MGAGWLVGVAINFVGSIMINLGTNVMKMGHNKLAAIACTPTRPRPAIYKLREWQLGVTLFSLGNIANFVSFGYAAQSLLAAIGCIQFVSNVIFASWVLKEQVSRDVLVATGAIVAGCVLLVSGGSHVSEKYTYKELLHLYGQPAYISYLVVGGVAVLLAYGGYWAGQKAVISKGPEATRLSTAALPILYAIFSALIGTQSVLFSKTLAVLLRSTVAGDNQLNKWFTWFVLVAFLTSAVFWVTRLNKGLKMFPALIIVPALQICWTLFSILSGMLYFHEYEGMRAGPTAMFVIGVAVVFVGVFLLTRASQPGAASQSSELRPLACKARIAYAGSDGVELANTAGNGVGGRDGDGCQLSAVRSGGPGLDHQPLAGVLRGAAQLQQQQQAQAECEDADASDEEEYERALLACTSGRCGGNISHLGLQEQQPHCSKQEQDTCAAAGAVAAAPVSPNSSSANLPQAAGHGSRAKPSRGKQRWLDKASSLKRRVALDFSLDEAAAAKLSLGLGDSHIPGFSLFTLPMVDIKEIPHESSTWRAAEAVEGRSYGRLPDTSLGGIAPQQGLPLPTMPAEFDETGCISQGGALNSAAGSNFPAMSFTWPPGASAPSEQELPMPLGPFTSINPLANAIDIKVEGLAAQARSSTVSQEEARTAAKPGSKWKVLQKAIKTNVKEFSSIVQAAADEASGGRAYARMTSKDEAPAKSGSSGGRHSDSNEELELE